MAEVEALKAPFPYFFSYDESRDIASLVSFFILTMYTENQSSPIIGAMAETLASVAAN